MAIGSFWLYRILQHRNTEKIQINLGVQLGGFYFLLNLVFNPTFGLVFNFRLSKAFS